MHAKPLLLHTDLSMPGFLLQWQHRNDPGWTLRAGWIFPSSFLFFNTVCKYWMTVNNLFLIIKNKQLLPGKSRKMNETQTVPSPQTDRTFPETQPPADTKSHGGEAEWTHVPKRSSCFLPSFPHTSMSKMPILSEKYWKSNCSCHCGFALLHSV